MSIQSDLIIRDVVLELLLERKPKRNIEILDPVFKHQTAFIQDPAKKKALFCTRRSAKSYTGGLYLIDAALKNPNANCLYIGLTRMSSKGIIWKDILKSIDQKYDLGFTFNNTELTATAPNGSVIHVTGIDADADEMQKLLGKKYKLVIIDEAASFRQDLRELVYGILGPALVDQDGTVCLLGTSGNLTKGLFFDITNSKEPGWKLFQWSAYDNPYVATQWKAELEDIKLNRPLFMETPLFRQWYLNEWVIDEDKLVYRFAYGRNEFEHLPIYPRGEWTYILGVDLGYSPDPSAFVVAAFHEHDKNLYFLDSFKQTEMDVTDVANRIKYFKTLYPIQKTVIDGANLQAVQEIQRRHDISLTKAEKQGKEDFIQIMNAEMIQGRVKYNSACQELIQEYSGLIWDERKMKRVEHSACANHLTDAALYTWKLCYTFLSEAPAPVINLRDKSHYIAHTQKLMEESLEKQIKREQAEERNEVFMDMLDNGLDNPLKHYVNQRRR